MSIQDGKIPGNRPVTDLNDPRQSETDEPRLVASDTLPPETYARILEFLLAKGFKSIYLNPFKDKGHLFHYPGYRASFHFTITVRHLMTAFSQALAKPVLISENWVEELEQIKRASLPVPIESVVATPTPEQGADRFVDLRLESSAAPSGPAPSNPDLISDFHRPYGTHFGKRAPYWQNLALYLAPEMPPPRIPAHSRHAEYFTPSVTALPARRFQSGRSGMQRCAPRHSMAGLGVRALQFRR